MRRATSVRDWTRQAGLDAVDGLSEHLESLASSRMDLAFLTDADWAGVLRPVPLKLGKRRRVEAAIRELRAAANSVPSVPHAIASEDDELVVLRDMFNGGSPPRHRTSPPSSGSSGRSGRSAPSPVAQTDFVPSAAFAGPHAGFVFKLSDRGLGYYKDQQAARHNGGDRGGGAAESATAARYQAEHEAAVRMEQARAIVQQREQLMRTPPPRQAQQLSPRSRARADALARLEARPF